MGDKNGMANLPDETDRPTNEVERVSSNFEDQRHWAHDADEERARLDPSASHASLMQIEQINPRIIRAVRKAMREEVHGFKGYLNAALSVDGAASLLEEGSGSKFHR